MFMIIKTYFSLLCPKTTQLPIFPYLHTETRFSREKSFSEVASPGNVSGQGERGNGRWQAMFLVSLLPTSRWPRGPIAALEFNRTGFYNPLREEDQNIW